MKKIVIHVHMENDKCRSKALTIAAAFQGVHSVSLEGESRDEVVVTGNGIDSVCLTNKLRKKFSYVTLVSVVDADEEGSEEEYLAETYSYANNPAPSCPPYHLIFDEGGDVDEEEQLYCMENFAETYHYANIPPPSCPPYYVINYDPYPNSCNIL